MVFLVIIGFALVFLREVPGLIQQKYWRELIIFCLLMAVAFILSVLLAMGVRFPYIATAIMDFFLE